MAWRWGPGPVFAIELRAAARRWQTYAGRAVFIASLLAACSIVWWAAVAERRSLDVKVMAGLGESFFYGLVGTQIAVLLLAAPAATAGAVCLEKARGSLFHLLVTDLSNAEIVLGKLAARLAPVFGLILAGVPVLAAAILLGGIEPGSVVGAFLISVGVTIFGCALALLLSIWANKTLEVLLAVYGLEALALLALPVWIGTNQLAGRPWGGPTLTWLRKSNPFWLAFAPYASPGMSRADDPVLFLAGAVILSAAFALLAVATIRRVGVRYGAAMPRQRRRILRFLSPWYWLPRPSLDGNPVLWREWHQRQPSRWLRAIGSLFAFAAIGSTALTIWFATTSDRAREADTMVNGLIVTIGLLMFSVSAVMSLSDERVRGSLDVLLTTPLSTRSIVWGKWWATYRSIPLLALLPAIDVAVMIIHFEGKRTGMFMLSPGLVLAPPNDWPLLLLLVALILAYGAMLTSLGLALATWVSRVGRAAALCATGYVFMTVFPVIANLLLDRRGESAWYCAACPFWGSAATTAMIGRPMSDPFKRDIFEAGFFWVGVYLIVAGALFALTLLTFDRCLGRARQGKQPHNVA